MTAPNTFIDVNNGELEVYINDKLVCTSDDTLVLAGVFVDYRVETIDCSSSVDFASEYGFDDDNEAKLIINAAFEIAEEF